MKGRTSIAERTTIETLYINRYFEVNSTNSTSSNISYYYLGGALVAMSENGTLKYVHQDHLSGTSLMTSNNGTILGTIKYTPYGETRVGDVPTDKKFTGQRLAGASLCQPDDIPPLHNGGMAPAAGLAWV